MKRIVIAVLSFHLVAIGWMALTRTIQKPKKEPLKIKTVVMATPEPKEVAQVTPVSNPPPPPPKKKPPPQKASTPPKKSPPKKKEVKKQPVAKKAPKKSPVSSELAQKLEMSLAKFDEKKTPQRATKKLSSPKWIPKLEVQQSAGEVSESYVQTLVQALEQKLDLPEVGIVKVALTLQSNQRCVRMDVLESASDRNRQFLEGALKNLTYPKFTGALEKKKEHTFVISFCNE